MRKGLRLKRHIDVVCFAVHAQRFWVFDNCKLVIVGAVQSRKKTASVIIAIVGAHGQKNGWLCERHFELLPGSEKNFRAKNSLNNG